MVSVSLQLKLLGLLLLLSWLVMTALDRSAGTEWAAGVVVTGTGIFGSSDQILITWCPPSRWVLTRCSIRRIFWPSQTAYQALGAELRRHIQWRPTDGLYHTPGVQRS